MNADYFWKVYTYFSSFLFSQSIVAFLISDLMPLVVITRLLV